MANLYSFPDIDTLAKSLRKFVLDIQNQALKRHQSFRVAVSGGSLPATLARALLLPGDGTPEDTFQFSKWEMLFADERVVPLDHAESNYRLIMDELVNKIPPELGKPNVHHIDSQHTEDKDPTEAAHLYEQVLTRIFAAKDSVKLPVFDLILLGTGPDGHTCSLFPGHPQLQVTDAWVVGVTNSPKSPPVRISLTLPVVTHAHSIAFITTGEGKKDILKSIFDEKEGENLPSALVNKGAGNKVHWFADDAATKGVSYPKRSSL